MSAIKLMERARALIESLCVISARAAYLPCPISCATSASSFSRRVVRRFTTTTMLRINTISVASTTFRNNSFSSRTGMNTSASRSANNTVKMTTIEVCTLKR